MYICYDVASSGRPGDVHGELSTVPLGVGLHRAHPIITCAYYCIERRVFLDLS